MLIILIKLTWSWAGCAKHTRGKKKAFSSHRKSRGNKKERKNTSTNRRICGLILSGQFLWSLILLINEFKYHIFFNGDSKQFSESKLTSEKEKRQQCVVIHCIIALFSNVSLTGAVVSVFLLGSPPPLLPFVHFLLHLSSIRSSRLILVGLLPRWLDFLCIGMGCSCALRRMSLKVQ